MLNIAETQAQVKAQPQFVVNAPNLRSWTGINEAYRQLKELGWHSVGKHQVERVPVFRLGKLDVYIWRDKSLSCDWTVQLNGEFYGFKDRYLEEITEAVTVWQAEDAALKVTTLTYDRHTNEWLASNALETQRFPAGAEGKRQAEMYALAHDVPAIAAEVEALVETADSLYMYDREGITRRAIKAGFILRDGKVWPGQAPGEVARVNGTADEPYSITTDSESHYCDCPDFIGERSPVLPNGEMACKHIMAIQIAAALDLDGSPLADGEAF